MNAKVLFGSVMLALIASMIFVAVVTRQGPPKSAPAEAFAEKKHTLDPLWPAPAFAYQNQHQALVTPRQLLGAPYVANFVFTECHTICPLLTAKMVQLQRRLQGVDLRFVSFSVDPGHDTPQVLAAYQQKWAADEARWWLLATDERTLPLTTAGFHVTAKKAPDGQVDPIIHSAVFVLVDEKGLVRGVYDSEHREDFAALEADARTLARAPKGPPSPAAKSGAELYHELSCVSCHENPALAPALGGLAGKRREFAGGLVLTADAAYVKESIVNPEARRVLGYPLHMPGYDGLLDEAGLEVLTQWVLALPADGARDGGDDGVVPALDPVCHMRVRPGADVPQASVDGGTVFFCSRSCRDRFVAHPDAFTR
jgi:protein SCO1/2